MLLFIVEVVQIVEIIVVGLQGTKALTGCCSVNCVHFEEDLLDIDTYISTYYLH